MKRLVILLLMVIAAAGVSAQRPLEIYVIDPEGGKAALWIAPSGETVLIDSGNPGARDLDRLKEVITAAGVTQIDYLISTHYHVDHIGGLQELVKQIPVGTFVDHGPTVEGPVVPESQGAGAWLSGGVRRAVGARQAPRGQARRHRAGRADSTGASSRRPVRR